VLDEVLEERFGIQWSYRSDFDSSIVAHLDSGLPIFRSWGEEFGRRTPADRAQSERLIARILGCPFKAIRTGRRRYGQRRTRSRPTG
jgi:hypothetical protein